MLYVGINQNSTTEKPLKINQVAQAVHDGKLDRIVIETDDRFRVVYQNGAEDGVESRKEPNASLVDQLISLGVTPDKLVPQSVVIEVIKPSLWGAVLTSLLYVLHLIFIAGLFWFIMRQAQGSNNAA